MEPERVVGILFAAVMGGVLGSFANVVIIRWHEAAPITGRSHCPGCKRTLRPRHMVPVLSWILLGGGCADCKRKIHVQYPVVEALCAALAVVAAARWDPFGGMTSFGFLFELILSVGLVVPVVMDLRWKELPVEYLVGFGALLLALRGAWGIAGGEAASPGVLVWNAAAIAFGAAVFLVQIVLSRGRWVGQGDAWFGGVMGAALGWPGVILGIYFAYLIGGSVALAGLLGGVWKRGTRLPFAPALAAGTLCTVWFGERILERIFMSYA